MDKQIKYQNLPYRLGVGMVILNKDKKIFLGRRGDSSHQNMQCCWQMPQGGIHLGETPSMAVMREIKEEIDCNNAIIIAETKHWYSYQIPKFLIPRLWHGAFKGQKQRWFLLKFLGEDEDINVKTLHPEFVEWKWIDQKQLISNIIPFKKKLYKAVLNEFKMLL